MMFPTLEWFEALKAAADGEQTTFRQLGWCDAKMRIDIKFAEETESYLLTFHGYSCDNISKVDTSTETDFALSAGIDIWCEMIRNIRDNGEADLEHTLSYLQLPGTIELIAPTQLDADIFYRFNQTFQQFFDLTSRVSTQFEH